LPACAEFLRRRTALETEAERAYALALVLVLSDGKPPGWADVIPTEERPHVPASLHLFMGDSRGRWEGTTLVVETTNFRKDAGAVYGNANPDTFKIVERFTRVAPDRLNYEFTISDPNTWTRPWTAMVSWSKITEQLYEYTTHEDNYDLVHLLVGARVREARGEKVPEPSGRPAGGGDDR